uniref:Uncharacterized protein n=1 Tax=Glossina brevipalpis TaxID=37001 RepID=A0A1A9X262_9MUSC
MHIYYSYCKETNNFQYAAAAAAAAVAIAIAVLLDVDVVVVECVVNLKATFVPLWTLYASILTRSENHVLVENKEFIRAQQKKYRNIPKQRQLIKENFNSLITALLTN